MGDKIVKSKNLCCQPVVFPSLSLLKSLCTLYLGFRKIDTIPGIFSYVVRNVIVGLELPVILAFYWKPTENLPETGFLRFPEVSLIDGPHGTWSRLMNSRLSFLWC